MNYLVVHTVFDNIHCNNQCNNQHELCDKHVDNVVVDDVDRMRDDIFEPFRQVLNVLINYDSGWKIITDRPNHSIVMNRQFYELDEISIQYKNSHFHFSLPIPNHALFVEKEVTQALSELRASKESISIMRPSDAYRRS